MTQFGVLGRDGNIRNAMEIDMNSVNSPDPLAYAYGFATGARGEPMGSKRGKAPEYIRGWTDGHRKFIAGKEAFIPSGMAELHRDTITKRTHYPYGDD